MLTFGMFCAIVPMSSDVPSCIWQSHAPPTIPCSSAWKPSSTASSNLERNWPGGNVRFAAATSFVSSLHPGSRARVSRPHTVEERATNMLGSWFQLSVSRPKAFFSGQSERFIAPFDATGMYANAPSAIAWFASRDDAAYEPNIASEKMGDADVQFVPYRTSSRV